MAMEMLLKYLGNIMILPSGDGCASDPNFIIGVFG
jgi:hypothetical protein